MLKIRKYRNSDSVSVSILIANTYTKFNLSFATPEQQKQFLGPFQHAYSKKKIHKEAIAKILQASMMFVAVNNREIVGVLRGKKDKLQSLFVDGSCHRIGIGRKLVAKFEQECLKQGATVIKLMSTIFAVPFNQAVRYKKSTGIRKMRSFEGDGLPYQPMKKSLS